METVCVINGVGECDRTKRESSIFTPERDDDELWCRKIRDLSEDSVGQT